MSLHGATWPLIVAAETMASPSPAATTRLIVSMLPISSVCVGLTP